MSRYAQMFSRLKKQNEIAFIPFVMLLDPSFDLSLAVIKTLIDSGADALELGMAFSDPLADGPIIQKAALRVLSNKGNVDEAMGLIKEVRNYNSKIPLGILTYANLVYNKGINDFYAQAKTHGADSILIADVPLIESKPFIDAAYKNEIDPILIAPPHMDEHSIQKLSELTCGYTYVVTRSGVTGVDDHIALDHDKLISSLKKVKAPPLVFGFGVSKPSHIKMAENVGASGVISGSKIISIIENNLDDQNKLLSKLREFIAEMKNYKNA